MKAIHKVSSSVVLLIISCTLSLGQEVVNDNISDLINDEINRLPSQDTDVYKAPGGSDLTAWLSLINKVITKEYALASTEATAIGYELINVKDQYDGNQLDLFLLRRSASSTNYWGTYVFNDAPLRPRVAIQSPHAIKDRNTGLEGVHVFRALGARAFFLTGTDRCNSKTKTRCSGTTSVCGSTESYRISDVAHNTASGFQLVTEQLYDIEAPYFIQLHGFTRNSTDPYVITSLGARILNGTSKMQDIEKFLLAEDGSLTFKNSSNNSWTRLLAFTNTQGRYINQGADPCSENSSSANGRFIHIEQDYTKLRASFTGWDVMARALAEVFPVYVDGVLDVATTDELVLFPMPLRNTLNVINPMENALNLKLMSMNGTVVKVIKIPIGQVVQDISAIKNGIYLYSLSNDTKILKRGSVLKVD